MNASENASGFTLAELLIALAILGVIATFTIPKIIESSQNEKFNALGKEAAAMISEAYRAYKVANVPTASTSTGDLTPYFNYVKADTTSSVDHFPDGTATAIPCGGGAYSTTWTCYRLHNGAILFHNTASYSFNGTTSTNAMVFFLDPDGKASGAANGPGKSITFWLYYDGKLKDYPNILNPTQSTNAYTPCASCNPDWWGNWN